MGTSFRASSAALCNTGTEAGMVSVLQAGNHLNGSAAGEHLGWSQVKVGSHPDGSGLQASQDGTRRMVGNRGAKVVKQKRCKVCRTSFTPSKPLQCVCGLQCALSLASAAKAKRERTQASQERKETKEKLEKLKSRADWAREAQAAFNRWVRLRDMGKPCISCQRHHTGQIHAGHFLSRGAHPELAYEPLNCHAQCAPCNTHLSGNQALYRKNLVELVGQDKVEWLEGPHEPKHYSVDDLKAIKAKYSAMARELEKANG